MNSIRSWQCGIAAISLAVIAACGGGSNGTPPTITTQPASVTVGEGGSASFNVSATGTDPLSYAWLNAGDSSVIAGATSAQLTRNPVSLADSGHLVRARISNGAGEALSDSASLSVTERSWSPTTDVAGYLRNAMLVVDSNGVTHQFTMNSAAGGSQHADVRTYRWVKHSDPTLGSQLAGGDEIQSMDVLTDPTTSITAAVNGTGHVMVAWHRNGLVGAALYTPLSVAGVGTWTLLPTRVSSFTAINARDPAVAAVGNTGFEFVWRERTGSNTHYDIMARHYTIAGDLLDSQIHTLEASSLNALAPRLVSDAAGNMLAAWQFEGASVVHNHRPVGSPWSTTTTVVNGGSAFQLEQLKANAAGKGLLLTSDRVGHANIVQLDLAHTPPVTNTAVANAYGSAPDGHVFADGSMQVYGVSVDTANGNASRLFRWSYTLNNVWGAAEPVSERSNEDFVNSGRGVRNPQVAGTDAEGNLLVVWEERDAASSGMGRIHARRFHAGLNAWRPIAQAAALAGTDYAVPVAAMHPNGSAVLALRNASNGAAGKAALFR